MKQLAQWLANQVLQLILVLLVLLVLQVVLTPSFLNNGGLEAIRIPDKVVLVYKGEGLDGVLKRDSRFKNRLYSN